MLARQVIHCLSHASILFCSDYLGHRVLLFVLTGLHLDPPVYWDDRSAHYAWLFSSKMESQKVFLPRLACDLYPLNFSLCIVWDDRYMPVISCWLRWDLLNSLLRLAWNTVHWISASQVARIQT
jgi:hypothetical protein